MIRFAAIVEGYGDVDALPALIARTGQAIGEEFVAPKPIRAGEWKSMRVGDRFESFLNLAASRSFERIVVLLDLDDGCAKDEAQHARERIERWVGGRQLSVSLSFAVREYETMFLHCIDDIASASPNDIVNADAIRGAKEALKPFIGRRYKETQDQLAFTKMMDVRKLYERSRSYRNFCKAVSGLSYDSLNILLAI